MSKDFDDFFCPFCHSNLGKGWFMEDCPCCDEEINSSYHFYDEDDDEE